MAWTDIQGQDSAIALLRSHAAAGRVANAYILAGPEGVGKRRVALEFAKALNCAKSPNGPCDACPACVQLSKGSHPDLHVLEPSGASEQIRIEPVRQMLERIALRPFNSRYQVVIIDGAERLTEEAANSLLKGLEEPPSHSRFLLVTARLSDCLPTIRSRCQLIRCRRLGPEIVVDADAAGRLAAEPLAWVTGPLPETRADVGRLIDGMVAWLRDVAVASIHPDDADLPVAHAEHGEAIRRQAAAAGPDRCLETAMELLNLRESLDQFANPRLAASLAREHWLTLMGAARV